VVVTQRLDAISDGERDDQRHEGDERSTCPAKTAHVG
jgi:hypothetical protein